MGVHWYSKKSGNRAVECTKTTYPSVDVYVADEVPISLVSTAKADDWH